ncbi:MAG: hypothetical protein ABFE08_07945 [Armatimonadia bacterium]
MKSHRWEELLKLGANTPETIAYIQKANSELGEESLRRVVEVVVAKAAELL